MVDAERCDYRDALVSIAFLNHGIEKLQLDTDKLYDVAITKSSQRMKKLLTSFKERNVSNKAIETMAGYTEYEFEEGPGFITHWANKFEPVHNLAKISFAISSYFASDKYLTGEVSVGSEIRYYWFDKKDSEKRSKIISITNGTSHLTSSLKKELSKNSDYLSLGLYLIEFKRIEESKLFIETLSSLKKLDKVVLFNNIDEIVYVLSSRYSMHGLTEYENNASLNRFQKPIESIIRTHINSH